MTERIIFLDFDGPMIPLRAYYMAGQTKEFVTKFDPVAVGLINRLAMKAEAKIVLHTSWRRTTLMGVPDLREHILQEGIKEEYLHEKLLCPMRFTSSRWHDIGMWLKGRDVENYVIIEDEPIPYGAEQYKDYLVQCSFENGFTYDRYLLALDKFNLAEDNILVF